MDIYKLIFISCLVFVLSFCLYIIVKKREKVKALILNLDNKLEKKFSKSNNEKNENSSIKENNGKQNNKSLNKNEVKLISYNSSSTEQENNIDSSKSNKNNVNKKRDNEKESDNSNSKLKPNKSVEQIRPIMLPPNEESEKRDLKLLEMKKQPEMLESSNQKSLDFKYGSKHMSSSKSERDFNVNRNQIEKFSDVNDFISFSNDKENNFNPLKRDVKKQYEDIKNFINLPENKSIPNQKSIDNKNFKNVNKIDASIFNSPDSHYVDYRNMDKSQAGFRNLNNQSTFKSNSNLVNNYNRTMGMNGYPQYNNFNNNLSANGDVMFTNTKYARNSGVNSVGMPSFDLTEKELSEASIFNKNFELTKDEENIDLNKLPNNLKKIIIQNILERRNYD